MIVNVSVTPQGCQVTTIFKYLVDGRLVEHVRLETPSLRPEPEWHPKEKTWFVT